MTKTRPPLALPLSRLSPLLRLHPALLMVRMPMVLVLLLPLLGAVVVVLSALSTASANVTAASSQRRDPLLRPGACSRKPGPAEKPQRTPCRRGRGEEHNGVNGVWVQPCFTEKLVSRQLGVYRVCWQ